MKITESYIRKIIQDELVGLLENASHSLSPEDKGVLMAVGQALEKAIETVSKYTNIDNDNESTHEGIIGIQSMLEDAVILQQKLLSGEPHEASDEYDNGESTKVADDDLRLISFALRPDATDEERKAANERLDQIIGQSPLQERKINNAFITKQQLIEAVVQNCPEADKAWNNLLNKQTEEAHKGWILALKKCEDEGKISTPLLRMIIDPSGVASRPTTDPKSLAQTTGGLSPDQRVRTSIAPGPVKLAENEGNNDE